MKYQFIEQHKQEFPVVVMCNVLGVSESGFYAWRKRPACWRKREDAQLTQESRQVYATHRGRYGSPRIHRELQDQGRSTSRKRVARLMREAELSAKGARQLRLIVEAGQRRDLVRVHAGAQVFERLSDPHAAHVTPGRHADLGVERAREMPG